ncbi:DUF1553 domain-containing protein [Thalassoglobus polymorphus]|uniref:Planctomycete cytochrome C n=1 Tax=Thalassoglobus polymorphus TaxID=2527994 RepID=A0A517QT71_9PLAN|nr:DUF1553 domain-containing protein [Thalassoglobus polymorphus]QDT34841.1 Planctomycete cytochrome C [Thalassoglobus polymorphus]
MFRNIVCFILVCSSSSCLAADVPTFESSGVAAILSRRCLSCHNDSERKGDFSLQSAKSLADSGMVISGDPESSHLLSVIQTQDGQAPRMPKAADPLTEKEIEAIKQWIQQGAHWPEAFELKAAQVESFDWWSFQPLERPEIPAVVKSAGSEEWMDHPVDAFILQAQLENGLTHSERASKRTLIRRLTYDLTGLPPTPEEIRAFLAETGDDAYIKLVDRLLDSPAYGEHWARHWLDVVKYADTCGYDKDKLRENAWPYRDYVIRSFNEEKPYSKFVQEQIAGDVLFPGESDGILGLGFIAAGPWDFIGHVEVPEAKLDGKVARNLDRDDMVSNVMNTFCSLTIQCARCHNHKFDPFTQEHYYSLQSIFAAVDRADRRYNTSPEIEQQRQELNAQVQANLEAQKQLKEEIEKDGGVELKRLNREIKSLEQLASPKEKQPQYGYHSQIHPRPTVEDFKESKWVQIDLGQPVEISQLVLHACHDNYAGIGSGFGFPVRYRIEGALRVKDFASDSDSLLLVDETAEDVTNPGLQPVIHSVAKKTVRFIRITATKLSERKNDYMFALAELEAYDTSNKNVALKANVTALDSIEAPVRWAKNNLTDGIWAKSLNSEAEAKLAAATRQRSAILARINTSERQSRKNLLEAEVKDFRKRLAALPTGEMVYAATTNFKPQGNFKPTAGIPRPVHLLHRGDIDQPREVVSPGVVPLKFEEPWELPLSPNHTEGEARAEFAKWVTRRDHPLTWRSIVNRVWHYHFGEGLVASPNDFGRMGQLPSHPELLDWLAVEFRDGGQSFKELHRLIVTSATYQQASTHSLQNSKIDGSNRYLWRMNRRRLTAEELRDSILAISGQLDRTPGGPGDRLFVLQRPEHSPHYEYHLFDPAKAKRHRRSIYRFVVRSQPDPWMTVFDCADSSQSTPKRSETLTALQVLSLMNNDFNLVMAERFAERLEAERESITDQIKLGMFLTTGREATEQEVQLLVAHTRKHGLANSCRLLLNLSELMFVD